MNGPYKTGAVLLYDVSDTTVIHHPSSLTHHLSSIVSRPLSFIYLIFHLWSLSPYLLAAAAPRTPTHLNQLSPSLLPPSPLLLSPQLSTWDVNETIAFCARRSEPSEALLWYLAATDPTLYPAPTPPATPATTTTADNQPSPRAAPGAPATPNDVTHNTLIAALAAAPDWTPLLFLLQELKLQGSGSARLSKRTYETLIRCVVRSRTYH